METYFGDFWAARVLFQRGLAAIYLTAFMVALNQFPALLGEHGLQPAPLFLKSVSFSSAPSLFHLAYSDALLRLAAWAGIALSAAVLLGLPEKGPFWVSMAVWLALWVLYLSIVNVGQTFYSFGWESMLLEAGFLAAFLGSEKTLPHLIPVLLLRWMLFRVELGAGLIKLKAGGCWHDLTCLFYHHETQPMPNPLSWYFHQLPKAVLKFGVVFSHFVQVIVPFALFGPAQVAAAAGLLILCHQLILIVSGNYSWLNWLTVVLAFTAFSDAALSFLKPQIPAEARDGGPVYKWLLIALASAVAVLSVKPVLNLCSRNQLMNFSYNPLHLINTYGAFGSVTEKRYEIVVEGTRDASPDSQTKWEPYLFKGKPVDPGRTPPQIAPYHLRLDWMMWFLPFRVGVSGGKLFHYGYEQWFVNFIRKLLEGDKPTLKLLAHNPFPEEPPRFIRARYYLYRFTTPAEKKETGAVWKRTLIGDYLSPVGRAGNEEGAER